MIKDEQTSGAETSGVSNPAYIQMSSMSSGAADSAIVTRTSFRAVHSALKSTSNNSEHSGFLLISFFFHFKVYFQMIITNVFGKVNDKTPFQAIYKQVDGDYIDQ